MIAGSFDPNDVEHVRARLAAVLGSFSETLPATSGRLAARLAGTPYDAHRIEMMEALVNVLLDRPPVPRPAAPPVARWEWLAFFEAYFSNFIEGTEFGVDEARRIAWTASSPKHDHRTLTTYPPPTALRSIPPIGRGHQIRAPNSSASWPTVTQY